MTAKWYGSAERIVEIASQTAVWYSTGLFAVPIRWVLVRDPQAEFKTQALLCTDLEADPQEAALRETAEAIGLVQASGRPVELTPQNAYVRRLQHQMTERNALMSRSRGSEPNRRVELLPEDGKAWR